MGYTSILYILYIGKGAGNGLLSPCLAWCDYKTACAWQPCTYLSVWGEASLYVTSDPIPGANLISSTHSKVFSALPKVCVLLLLPIYQSLCSNVNI